MRKPVLPQRRAVCGRGIAPAAADLKFLPPGGKGDELQIQNRTEIINLPAFAR
jgi:hypothetical protein